MSSNLGPSNNYWRVVRPFNLVVRTGSVPSNAWYGSSRIFKPVYEKATVTAGDEIHNLHGGLFAIIKGRAHEVRMEEPEFAPFEHSYSSPDRFPLDKMEKIDESEAFRVNYGEVLRRASGEDRLGKIARRLADSEFGR